MSNVFQTRLKGFKLKMMVVEQKTAQPVEPYKEPIDLLSSIGRRVQKPFLYFTTLVQPVKVEPQLVEVEPQPVKVQSKGG